MNKAIILVGNIGCGKSTLSRELSNLGYNIICRDALRYMIGAGSYKFNVTTESFIASANLEIVTSAVKCGLDIVIDETNVCRKIRKRYLDIITTNFNYEIIAIELPRLEKKVAVDRRMVNPHGQPDRAIWNNVWEMFDSLYQKPTIDEGFDKVVSLSEKSNITQILKETL